MTASPLPSLCILQPYVLGVMGSTTSNATSTMMCSAGIHQTGYLMPEKEYMAGEVEFSVRSFVGSLLRGAAQGMALSLLLFPRTFLYLHLPL
ncbi:hypothetical protein M3J09_004618 [Ascochyta lentis]